MITAQVYLDAAQWLRENGWVQDRYGTMDIMGPDAASSTWTHACAVGALGMAVSGNPYATFKMQSDVFATLAGVIQSDGVCRSKVCEKNKHAAEDIIACWNDEDGRTKDEVIIALEQAAAEAKRVQS